MKILLVEDERLLADAIATLLKSQGFEVEPVYDGCTGMAHAELGIYDLMIVDVIMPGLDGYSFARKVV